MLTRIGRYLWTAAIVLAACSGGGDTSAPSETTTPGTLPAAGAYPECSAMYEPGRPVADVVADSEDPGMCATGPDDVLLTVLVSWTCPDGRTVYEAGDGWGWGMTDGQWQADDVPTPYADCVMPGSDAQHP